jgi:hypothetical protein
VVTVTITGEVTNTLLMRGATLTITGEASGVAAGAGAGLFGGTLLTAEAAGVGAAGEVVSGIRVRGKSEIISSFLETLALRLKDESSGKVRVMSPDIVLNP